jgi:hypothetical protein
MCGREPRLQPQLQATRIEPNVMPDA